MRSLMAFFTSTIVIHWTGCVHGLVSERWYINGNFEGAPADAGKLLAVCRWFGMAVVQVYQCPVERVNRKTERRWLAAAPGFSYGDGLDWFQLVCFCKAWYKLVMQ